MVDLVEEKIHVVVDEFLAQDRKENKQEARVKLMYFFTTVNKPRTVKEKEGSTTLLFFLPTVV